MYLLQKTNNVHTCTTSTLLFDPTRSLIRNCKRDHLHNKKQQQKVPQQPDKSDRTSKLSNKVFMLLKRKVMGFDV